MTESDNQPSNVIQGPWSTPDLNQEFSRAHDPNYIVTYERINHCGGKGEGEQQRDGGESGTPPQSGSMMVEKEQPQLNMQPPPEIREPVDRDAFFKKMQADRDAALQAAEDARQAHQKRNHTNDHHQHYDYEPPVPDGPGR